MAKYDTSTSGSSGNQRGYATSLKVSPFIKLDGTLSAAFSGGGDHGQSIAVSYEDGALVDGILTTYETDYGNTKFKVMSWNAAPVVHDETLSCDDLPAVLTATHGSKTYTYEILGARLQGDPETGYEDDVEIRDVAFSLGDDEEVPTLDDDGPIDLGLFFRDDLGEPDSRFTVWESASEYGPSASAKTTVGILMSGGKENVLDEDSQHNWLADGVNLRPDLEGLPVRYQKVTKESNTEDEDGNTREFHHPSWETADGNQVMPDNEGGGEQSSGGQQQAAADGGTMTDDDSDGPVAEFVSTAASLDLDTEAAIEGLFEDMTSDDDYPITKADVDDVSEVVERVQNKVAAKTAA